MLLLMLEVVLILPIVQLKPSAKELLTCELLHSQLSALLVCHPDKPLPLRAHLLLSIHINDILINQLDLQDLACFGEMLQDLGLSDVRSQSLHEQVCRVLAPVLLPKE